MGCFTYPSTVEIRDRYCSKSFICKKRPCVIGFCKKRSMNKDNIEQEKIRKIAIVLAAYNFFFVFFCFFGLDNKIRSTSHLHPFQRRTASIRRNSTSCALASVFNHRHRRCIPLTYQNSRTDIKKLDTSLTVSLGKQKASVSSTPSKANLCFHLYRIKSRYCLLVNYFRVHVSEFLGLVYSIS